MSRDVDGTSEDSHGSGSLFFQTTEDFYQRDFKTKMTCYGGTAVATGSAYFSQFKGRCFVKVYLIGDSGEILLWNGIGSDGLDAFPMVSQSSVDIIISPSLITNNKVDFYFQGSQINSVNYIGKYKIKIYVDIAHAWDGDAEIYIQNPRWKSQETCAQNEIRQLDGYYYICRYNSWNNIINIMDLSDAEQQNLMNIINQLQLSTAEKQRIIAELTTNLQGQIIMINNLQASLNEKIQLAQSLQSNLNNQIALVSQLQTTLAQKILIVQQLSNNINEQAIIIKALTSKSNEQTFNFI